MTKENPETQLNNFIKTQEIPHTTNSGYLAYGSKMNPKTQASALKILIAIPIAHGKRLQTRRQPSSHS